MAIIIIISGVFIYRFIYKPLIVEKEDLIVNLGQKNNQLMRKEEDIEDLEKIQNKYISLVKELEYDYYSYFSTSSEINNFIIDLKKSDLIVDVNYNTDDDSLLIVEPVLKGSYNEIYKYFSELEYMYDTGQAVIERQGEDVEMEMTLFFPIREGEK